MSPDESRDGPILENAVDAELLKRLPVAYAVALALHDAGIPQATIADQLEVPEASVPTLLKIASAKVEGLRKAGRASAETSPEESA